jgi:hypothetical protein
MKSQYANDVAGQTGPGAQPKAPVISGVQVTGNQAALTVVLPSNSVDGQPLAAGAFSFLHAFADKQSFLGRLEALAGMEPQASMPADPREPGKTVTIEIPGLEWDTKYYFTVCVE